MFRPPAFSRLSGLGPLPRLFEAAEGSRALRRLLAAEGLAREGLSPRTPVPFASLNEIFNRATRLAANPLFPLHVARATRPEDYGPLVDFALEAGTLGAGIGRICRLARLQSNAMVLVLARAGDTAVWSIRYTAAQGLRIDHHALHVLLPMIGIVLRYAGPGARPTALHLASAADPAHRALECALAIPVRADAPAFAVVFPAEWLALPRQEPRSSGRSLAQTLAYYRGERLPTSTRETVAALLAPLVGDAEGDDLDAIAQRLAVSRRTLQQRLSMEGSSFRDIVLDVRIGRAKQMLLGGDARLAEVALSVGYSDQAHFTRAFKMRTGWTPQAFRRHGLAGPSAAAMAE